MTNCFFVTIQSAFRHSDFHEHFPCLNEKHPEGLFQPYFQSLESMVSLLYKLAVFLESMYGYVITNDGSQAEANKGKPIYHCMTHVLLNGHKVDDQAMGSFVHHLINKEVKLEDMLRKGYYDGQGMDPLLVLLCEFTGVMIDVEVAAMTQRQQFPNQPSKTITLPKRHFVYKRLNTTCCYKVHLRFTQGHASFVSRECIQNTRKRKATL